MKRWKNWLMQDLIGSGSSKKLITFLLLVTAINGHTQVEQLKWDFFHPVKLEWRELGTKGSVQEALIETGEMLDPFYGINELKFNWMEDHDWKFKSIFIADSAILRHDHVELDFGSIDTYATIRLNDSLVGETGNAFIPHVFDVMKYLKIGVNELEVTIIPPVRYHAERWNTERYHLPAPNDVHDTAIAPYTRKPQYQFGWDWSLRMNTIGFNKPTRLIAYNKTRLINRSIVVNSIDGETADVTFKLFLSNVDNLDSSLIWNSELFGDVQLDRKDDHYEGDLTIEEVKLWWPRGFGDQNLYHDHIGIQTLDNNLLVSFDFKYGIKKSQLIQEADQWGTSYYFKINGKRIFCKGANYIPQDVFPARVQDQDIREMVEIMAESSFNMVRVWGGGYYPDEVFFESCDELGIMVWQDLMFACAMYPGWDSFTENVKKEFEYQVPRIAAHPSVMQFNGNNEVEVAWSNWGFQIKYGIYGKQAREVEDAYDLVFKKIAKDVVAESGIPYIHTSPLSNWGKAEFYNHGSQHYWGVWHGKDPIEDFGKKIGRFNAEYGFQSFPEYSTLKTFSTEQDWDISSEVMKHHQKSYVGNDMILKHAKRLYGNPVDFEEFVYFSQLTQAKAVSMAIAGHRIDAPRCGGTLVWQLNDCWPVSSWSSVDYYGNWKALQHSMKQDYRDVTVLAQYEDLDDVKYHLLAELPGQHSVEFSYSIYTLRGKRVDHHEETVTFVDTLDLQFDIPNVKKGLCRKQIDDRVITFKWTVDRNKNYERTFDEIGAKSKRVKPDREDIELELINVDEEKGTAQIELKIERFVRDLWISSDKTKVKFSKNFETYLPGSYLIDIQFEELPQIEDLRVMFH